jgi:cell division protein FtsI (penicillin-binding protein 3)
MSPDKRRNLTGEQLRNRAVTDTFEPGSTMKPITIAMALEAGRVSPQTVIDTGTGALPASAASRSATRTTTARCRWRA